MPALAQQDEAEILRARDAAFSDGDLQAELPAPAEFPTWFELPDWLLSLGEGFATVFEVVIWIAIGVAALFLIKSLIESTVGKRRLRAAASREVDLAGTRLDIELSQVEGHAARGDYAEAIHLLLLSTLTELCRLASIRLDPSLTSREIVATIPMPGPAKEALAGLVAAVEVSHFGEADVGEADYAHCRSRFDVFVESLAGGER